MANIILDSRKIMVYEDLKYLAEATGKKEGFADRLWEGLLNCNDLYEEFLYYLDNKALKDTFSFEGYNLTDIYVSMIGRYNLLNDIGKNTAMCSKESMVLETFMGMLELMENPTEYKKKLQNNDGMDKL